MRIRRILIPALIAVAAALLYLPQLADAPFYLGRDEMFFGLTGHAVATTGRDTNGMLLPLYFQSPMRYGSEMWFQPLLMYSTAASVKLFGLSEGTIRLPMTLLGIADVVLIYFVGRLLFRRELPAIGAAMLLALTPAHFINSRVAMDFQAPLPFTLAWLVCVLAYLARGKPAWLAGAGLSLGLGLYTYIASYMLMPVYGLLTCGVLMLRREPVRRYGLLAAAFLVPALSSVPFLLTHPTVIRDVLWHYDRNQPQAAVATNLFVSYFDTARFGHAASVYARFWNPRFLFIDGPGATWSAGVFLLPVAGLVILGMWRMLGRPTQALLLIGGLLTAPIPASLAGDFDAVHRASGVLVFAVLLAIAGLESLSTIERLPARAIAFLATWFAIIFLATSYHANLPLAQAYARAATVPIGVAVLFALWRSFPRVDSNVIRLVAIAGGTLALLQVAYLALGYSLTCWVSVIVLAIALAKPGSNSANRQALIVVALATACSHYVFAYLDSSGIHRIGPIPATAMAMATRFLLAAVAAVAMAAAAWILRGVDENESGNRWATVAMAITIVIVQVAYFRLDYFADARLRMLQTLLVLIALVPAAALLRRSISADPFRLGLLTTVAVLGIVSIQFAYFDADYFTRYRDRAGNLDTEGNSRAVWEKVISRAGERPIPAIYIASVGPYGFADLYWKFYTLKHGRADLLNLTVAEKDFDLARVRDLPDRSLVITSPSARMDETIDRMMAAGEIADKTLITAPDDWSRFWLLQTRHQAVRP